MFNFVMMAVAAAGIFFSVQGLLNGGNPTFGFLLLFANAVMLGWWVSRTFE